LSTEQDKFKHSKRLLKDENAVKKQVRIAKEHGVPIKDAHKFVKQHVMNCGNPNCVLCGNPRKIYNQSTLQERRMFQDLDKEHDRHSNGLKKED
jgi:heterodisulfide reductase subunit C